MHFCRRKGSFCMPMSYQLAAMDPNFHLDIVAEAPSGQIFFQLKEEMVVTGC